MEKKVCLKCGSEENVDPTEYMNCPIRDIMEKNDWCYYCSFWQNLYNENKDNPRWIRVDGSSWILGEEVKKLVLAGVWVVEVDGCILRKQKEIKRYFLRLTIVGTKVIFRMFLKI